MKAVQILLSFIAGFVDTCVFVALFGLFTAHVTGNFVLIGAELVHPSGNDVLVKLAALPVFVLAVAAAVRLTDALERRGAGRVAPVLYLEALLLALAWLCALQPWARATDPSAVAAGLLAVAAMGLQNALMRLDLASLPSTTVMTLTVTQATIDAVTVLAGSVDPGRREQARKRLSLMWPQIAAFTVGAAAGAWGYALAGLTALLAPAVLCIVVGVRWTAEPATA